MKKLFAFILVITICLTTSACSSCKFSGHTTHFGTCSTCGKYINEYKIITVPMYEYLTKSKDHLNSALLITGEKTTAKDSDYVEKRKQERAIEKKYEEEIKKMIDDFDEAYRFYDNSEDLSELKVYFSKMQGALDELKNLHYKTFKSKFIEQYDIYMDNYKKASELLRKWNTGVDVGDDNFY